MFQLFHALTARLKALFVTNVALDFEQEFATRHAQRKAQLLRQATDYDKEGLPEVASELRQRAAEIDVQKPLASVLPSVEHWQRHASVEGQALTSQTERHLLPPARGKRRK